MEVMLTVLPALILQNRGHELLITYSKRRIDKLSVITYVIWANQKTECLDITGYTHLQFVTYCAFPPFCQASEVNTSVLSIRLFQQ